MVIRPLSSGGIKGAWGICLPLLEALLPYLPSPPEKNGKNQPFLAIFLIFAPSEMHFSPSMLRTKNSGAATAFEIVENMGSTV